MKIKKLNINTTQGFAGELARENQFVFNYRADDARCEIALTITQGRRAGSARPRQGRDPLHVHRRRRKA